VDRARTIAALATEEKKKKKKTLHHQAERSLKNGNRAHTRAFEFRFFFHVNRIVVISFTCDSCAKDAIECARHSSFFPSRANLYSEAELTKSSVSFYFMTFPKFFRGENTLPPAAQTRGCY
jgi:hypothetical protein